MSIDVEKEQKIRRMIQNAENLNDLSKNAPDKEIEMDVNWLVSGAKNGDVCCQYYLALFYYQGYVIKQDFSNAFMYCEAASKCRNKPANHLLSLFYEIGIGTKRDHKKSISIIQGIGYNQLRPETFDLVCVLADENYPYAHLLLGHCYYFCIRREQNLTKAFDWYLKAANSGQNEEAMYFVAFCYDYGMGTLPDKEKASLWYHNSNHKSNDMARAFWYKVGVEHGSSRAKEVYEKNIIKS